MTSENVVINEHLPYRSFANRDYIAMWCKSICLSWVDSPYLGNESGKLLSSSERKWGVAGE